MRPTPPQSHTDNYKTENVSTQGGAQARLGESHYLFIIIVFHHLLCISFPRLHLLTPTLRFSISFLVAWCLEPKTWHPSIKMTLRFLVSQQRARGALNVTSSPNASKCREQLQRGHNDIAFNCLGLFCRFVTSLPTRLQNAKSRDLAARFYLYGEIMRASASPCPHSRILH